MFKYLRSIPKHKPTPPAGRSDDLLLFKGVSVDTETPDAVFVSGIPTRSDAKYVDACWLPKSNIIINHKMKGPRSVTHITMPRWRAFNSAIQEDAADAVYRVDG